MSLIQRNPLKKKPKSTKPRTGSPVKQKTAAKTAPKNGNDDLFHQVIALTGIPAETIKRELKCILDRKNIDVNNLTLEQLRVVVASYLREIMGGLLDRYNHRRTENTH